MTTGNYKWEWQPPPNYPGPTPSIVFRAGKMRVQLGAFWVDDPTDQQMTDMWFVKTALNDIVVNIATTMSAPQATVVEEILAERRRQETLWGAQHHPNFPTPLDSPIANSIGDTIAQGLTTLRDLIQAQVDLSVDDQRAWSVIFLEEVFEAVAETEWPALRKELIQCAAVILNWVEDGDHREMVLEDEAKHR